MSDVRLLVGDLLDQLPTLEPRTIDAIVTDPPYGLGFMGREWDQPGREWSSRRPRSRPTGSERRPPLAAGDYDRTLDGNRGFQAWTEEWARELLRVAKPGAHLVAFGGTRTHHRLMVGLEDAGWEIRDCGVWLFRSGWPKSLDVSKAIDRAAGAVRTRGEREWKGGGRSGGLLGDDGPTRRVIYEEPVTDDAKRWQGFGTALKPAVEPWVLARAPMTEPTVAANVLRWGTGALNIDAARYPIRPDDESGRWGGKQAAASAMFERIGGEGYRTEQHENGRWPANAVTLEDDPELRWFRASGGQVADYRKADASEKPWDGGGASGIRKRTRECRVCGSRARKGGVTDAPWPSCGHEDWAWVEVLTPVRDAAEAHPTVKPLALMRHLVRLVTAPGQVVLDPFAGSGTTGEAALAEARGAVLIEREAAYVPLIERRLARAQAGLPLA